MVINIFIRGKQLTDQTEFSVRIFSDIWDVLEVISILWNLLWVRKEKLSVKSRMFLRVATKKRLKKSDACFYYDRKKWLEKCADGGL